MSFVLDASAVLALLWDEPGAERVAEALAGARISTVNLAELVGKLVDRGATDSEAVRIVDTLGIAATAFDEAQALATGLLRRNTRAAGLSLGDRACLALARRDSLVALTADRVWKTLAVDIPIEVIR